MAEQNAQNQVIAQISKSRSVNPFEDKMLVEYKMSSAKMQYMKMNYIYSKLIW